MRAELELDFAFFTISPAAYKAPEVVSVAATLTWADESPVVVLLSEHPAKKTPATRRAITAVITRACVFIENCTSPAYKTVIG